MRRRFWKKMYIGLALVAFALYGLTYAPARSCVTAQESSAERFQKSFPLTPGSTVKVENYKGKILLDSWEKSEVSVEVFKNYLGDSGGRTRWLSDTRVDFVTSSGRLAIKVEYPHNRHDGHYDYEDNIYGEVELTIHLPRRVNLDLNAYKSEIGIRAIEGDIHIESYKSPIDIQSTVGAIKIDTYKEGIKLKDVSIKKSLFIKIYKGEVDVDAREIGDSITFDTYKADVVMRLPESIRLTINMDGSKHADFESDFPVTLSSRLGGDAMQGTVNGGGSPLHFKTYKGSLALRRR
ncbi:MAG: hypothetical protein AB1489_23235 [Acidobacteriota bacterium]